MIVSADARRYSRYCALRTLLFAGVLAVGMCVGTAARAESEPVQLQLKSEGSAGLAGWISKDGFPALSGSGEQLAILLGSRPPSDESAVLEIRSVTSGRLLERYELVTELDPLRLDPSMRDQRAAKITSALETPNRRLRAGNFQTMGLKLLDMYVDREILESWRRGYWEGERLGFRVRIENADTATLSVENDTRRLHVTWPPKDLGYPRETGDPNNCISVGMPMRAWLHPRRVFVVLEVARPGNHHSSCDETTEWQIERLRPIKAARAK